MTTQNITDRRLGFQPYGHKQPSSFTPPIKIDEAETEEGGAEVKDIPFYRSRLPGLGGPHSGNRSRKASLDRGFDQNSSRRMPQSEAANTPKVLQAQVIPERTR